MYMKKQKPDFKLDIKLPDIDAKKIQKKLIKGSIIGGLLVGSVIGASIYFNHYKWSYQSPVLIQFQTPVIIQKRDELVSPIIEEVENTIAPEVEASTGEEVETRSPSQKLVEHSQARPGVYGKIVEHFGDDSVIAGEILARESSLNPQAVNASSGACGLVQALPCEKLQCDLEDVDCQLEWFDEYVQSRYGSLENALEFHDQNGWY